MSWNKGLPGNSEKIRNLGIVIRPNWEAIEEGDDVGVSDMLQMRSVQLDNRTGLAANLNPITNAGTHYLYSRDFEVDGTQEAFMKDSAGNIIQLSEDGNLGSTGTNFFMNQFAFGTSTDRVFNENNMIPAWGFVTSAGALSYSQGVASVSGPSSSQYTITLSADVVATTSYIVLVTCFDTSRFAVVQDSFAFTAGATPQFVIRTFTTSGTGSASNSDFMFMVIGGQ